MHSIGVSVKLTVVVFSGFILHVACLDNKRQCYDLGEKSICYFLPSVSYVDWDTAWKTCRDLKSTLPVIPNKEVQTVLVKYLSNKLSILSVWTAGRYTGGSEWKWLNGHALLSKDEPSCLVQATACHHETQAVLTQRLRYEAYYPHNILPYICSFTGASCTSESNDITRWEAGCLQWEKYNRKNLNEARNECIERGGDLAMFNGQEDLQNLKQFLHMFNTPDTRYWIGLHRKWWIWNATDVQDIKYNLLKNYENHGLDCLFSTDRSDEWRRDHCTSTKRVICQTVMKNPTTAERPRTDGLDSSTQTWFSPRNGTSSQGAPLIDPQTGIIIGAIAVVVVVIITVVLAIAIKRSKNKRISHPTEEKMTVPHEMSTQQIQNKSIKSKTNEVDEISNHYAEIGRVNYENNDECRDEPQTAILYAALEFDANKAIYEEPVISSQRKEEAGAPAKFGTLNGNGQHGSSAESPIQAAEGTIYANM